MLQGLVKDMHGSCDPLQGNVGLPRNLTTKVVAKTPPGKVTDSNKRDLCSLTLLCAHNVGAGIESLETVA